MVNKKTKLVIALVIIIVAVFSVIFYVQFTSHPQGKVVNTNTKSSYAKIQEAINAPETKNGDTLLVYPGIYRENIVVNKSITVIGLDRDKTIIEQGENSVIILLIQADNVTVANLTVRNSVFGIWSRQSFKTKIANNTVINCTTGIRVELCSNCTVEKNKILNGKIRGIHLYNSTNSILVGNYIAHIFNETGYGAVHLQMSNYTDILLNQFVNNTYAFWLESSSHNKVYHNNFVSSSKINMFAGCFSNIWDNGYPTGGNYWSDYNGVDANSDGIGDVPYEKWGIIDQYPFIEPIETGAD